MAFVIIEKGTSEEIGEKFPLSDKPAIIGRGTTGYKPDIPLQDERISRRHVEISFENRYFLLRDLNSTNGTTIDGRKIEPNKLHRLKQDSIIGLAIVPGGEACVVLRFKENPTTETTRVEVSDGRSSALWLTIDTENSEVFVDGKQVIMSRKEFDLIACLYQKSGGICQRDELIEKVWPEVVDSSGVSDAAIDQLIHRLRLKIEPDPTKPERLISRKGFGYILTLR